MKKLILIALLFAFTSCSKPAEVVQEHVYHIDTLYIYKTDTVFVHFNFDSMDRVELIRDSILFRKTVRLVNGGYNGFAERYEIWLRIRNKDKK